MLYILVTFYATMAAAGYVVEILFGALGIIPTNRAVEVLERGLTWNYTSYLDLAFLVLAAIFVWRFLVTGGPSMLRMMSQPKGAMTDGHGHVTPATSPPESAHEHHQVPQEHHHGSSDQPGH